MYQKWWQPWPFKLQHVVVPSEDRLEQARIEGEIARAKKKAKDAEMLSVILVFIIIYLLIF